MAVTLAVSYLAQKKDANMEKYKSCGQGKVCLHIPTWFLLQREFFSDKGSTEAYGDGTDVKKSFNDLVSLAGFSGGETLRLNLMSPCKADIQVKAGEGDNACKCETFYGQDKIWYRFNKINCVLDINGDGNRSEGEMSVNLVAPGVCPETYEVKTPTSFGPINIPQGKYPVLTETYNPLDFISGSGKEADYGPFSDCAVSKNEDVVTTLQKCVDAKTHTGSAGCPEKTNDEKDTCLKNEYRECYSSGKTEGCAEKDFGGIKMPYENPFYVKNSKLMDTIPVPLNLLPSVDKTKPAETISVCENSWVASKLHDISLDPNKEDYEKKCITVTPDYASMKTYSESGFGTNFCAKSDISVMAKVESACFWGTIAVSFGAEMASMGAATPVVLYALGSSGAVCEKLTQMRQKWPNNQF